MSNELGSFKFLVCPADRRKSPAASFAQEFSDTNISYFVGVDAKETEPHAFLTGDRNLMLGRQPFLPGLLILSNRPAMPLGWTRELHHSSGNIGMADGSVQQLNRRKLIRAAQDQGLQTTRLAVP